MDVGEATNHCLHTRPRTSTLHFGFPSQRDEGGATAQSGAGSSTECGRGGLSLGEGTGETATGLSLTDGQRHPGHPA